MQKLHERNIPFETIFLGPVILFELMEAISNIEPQSEMGTIVSGHPPAKARRSAIIQDNFAPGEIPEVPLLDHIVDLMKEFRRPT